MLREKTLNDFLDILASNSPAPGGGSVAALCGSLSSALVAMVGGLTVGREKYKEFEQQILEAAKQATVLRSELLKLVDDDTESYNEVTAVLAMPKETAEQKSARSAAMQSALKSAALTPLITMEKGLECVKLVASVYGKTNASAISDLGVAALCSVTCVRSAWLNVKINLTSIKDAEFVTSARERALKALKECEELAECYYRKIEESIE